jgi:hypothetical protein
MGRQSAADLRLAVFSNALIEEAGPEGRNADERSDCIVWAAVEDIEEPDQDGPDPTWFIRPDETTAGTGVSESIQMTVVAAFDES